MHRSMVCIFRLSVPLLFLSYALALHYCTKVEVIPNLCKFLLASLYNAAGRIQSSLQPRQGAATCKSCFLEVRLAVRRPAPSARRERGYVLDHEKKFTGLPQIYILTMKLARISAYKHAFKAVSREKRTSKHGISIVNIREGMHFWQLCS